MYNNKILMSFLLKKKKKKIWICMPFCSMVYGVMHWIELINKFQTQKILKHESIFYLSKSCPVTDNSPLLKHVLEL